MKLVELECPKCGAVRKVEIKDQTKYFKCPNCGNTIMLDESDIIKLEQMRIDEGREIRKGKSSDDDKEFKRIILLVLIPVLLYFGVFGFYQIREWVRDAQEKAYKAQRVVMTVDASALVNQDYRVVQRMLRDMGFVDIECIPDADLRSHLFYNAENDVGKVKKVTIRGNSDFKKSAFLRDADVFLKSDKVRIYYHVMAK
ncbi:MAG: hypothetical protein IKP40_09275 [Clostridia bacterium]|nr:hypothetical protein [Clostridia bacterium]